MPQLLVTVNDKAMLPKVRTAIKILPGVDAVSVPRKSSVAPRRVNAARQRQTARIDELARLETNWDDEGALPIERQVLDNTRKLIAKMTNAELNQWTLFPDVNGTVMMEDQEGEAVLSIGNSDFSFSGPNKSGDAQKLSTAALLKTIRSIYD